MKVVAAGIVLLALGFFGGRLSVSEPVAVVRTEGIPVTGGEIEWGFFATHEPKELAERACGNDSPLRSFANTDSAGLTNWYVFECSVSE
jgi:hypothetical protein